MDLCQCSVNHSTHNHTWYYSEAGLLCRQREMEDIILFYFVFLLSSHILLQGFWVHTELRNKQYLGHCSHSSLSPLWVNGHLLSSVGVALIPDAEQSHQKFIPDQAAIMSQLVLVNYFLKL